MAKRRLSCPGFLGNALSTKLKFVLQLSFVPEFMTFLSSKHVLDFWKNLCSSPLRKFREQNVGGSLTLSGWMELMSISLRVVLHYGFVISVINSFLFTLVLVFLCPTSL